MTTSDLELLMSENVIDLEEARLFHFAPEKPSTATIDRWIRSGKLRVFRAGGRRRFTSVEECGRCIQRSNQCVPV
jgi:hypothetical protein